MHEQLEGGTATEGFYFAADYERVSAVFVAFDELLELEGVGF
jgi:hypothetical protein